MTFSDTFFGVIACAVRGSLQQSTALEGREAMCQDVKVASLGDAWHLLVNALSSCGVSMTNVEIGDLACSYVGAFSNYCDALLLQLF